MAASGVGHLIDSTEIESYDPGKVERIWEEAVYTVATTGGTRLIVVGHGGPTGPTEGKPY